MIPFIGLASGLGGGNTGSGEGPLFLKDRLSMNADWRAIVSLKKKKGRHKMKTIAELNRELAEFATALAATEPFFVSVGGDHSSAVGVWSGVAKALRPRGDLGLIWFDAHMDSHTPMTSESGNIHGMPLAALMGHGDPFLTQIADPFPKINPQNLVLIGVRDFEPAEEILLKLLKVRVYHMSEVKERGLAAVIQEALAIVTRGTVGYGVSFDLDCIDPASVAAVGTPVSDGINAEEFLSCLPLFQKQFPLVFELVEYIPTLDRDLSTFHFIQRMLRVISHQRGYILQTHL